MGNDMFNEEQLAHAKAQAERGAPATTLDISRRLTDDEIRTIFTSPMVSTTETYEAIALRFEVTRARREEERLRLALETIEGVATGQPGEIPTPVETGWSTALASVLALLSKAAPPADAATEAYAAFGRALLPKWWDDGNPGDIDGGDAQDAAENAGLWHHVERHAPGVECDWCNNEEPCGELTEAGLLALSPAPAPSAKETR